MPSCNHNLTSVFHHCISPKMCVEFFADVLSFNLLVFMLEAGDEVGFSVRSNNIPHQRSLTHDEEKSREWSSRL